MFQRCLSDGLGKNMIKPLNWKTRQKHLTFLFARSTSVSFSSACCPPMSPFEDFREREWEPKTSSFSLPFVFSFPGKGGTLKTWPLDDSWLLMPVTGFCFFTRAPLSWSRRKERAALTELAVRLRTLGPLLFVRPNATGGRRGVGSSGLGMRLWTGLWGGWGVIRATRNLTERAVGEITWPKTTIWVVSGPSVELHKQQEDGLFMYWPVSPRAILTPSSDLAPGNRVVACCDVDAGGYGNKQKIFSK